VIGEIGDTDCTHEFVDQLMPWADANGISYLAWAWVVSDCADEPSLITADSGTPSGYGVGVRNHLQNLASTPTATATAAVPSPGITPTAAAGSDGPYMPLVMRTH
jgi:hypothetical protein